MIRKTFPSTSRRTAKLLDERRNSDQSERLGLAGASGRSGSREGFYSELSGQRAHKLDTQFRIPVCGYWIRVLLSVLFVMKELVPTGHLPEAASGSRGWLGVRVHAGLH